MSNQTQTHTPNKNQAYSALKPNYRASDVMALFGIGQSTLYDLIKRKELPPPIKIGRSSVWLREEIDDVIEKRKQAREAAA